MPGWPFGVPTYRVAWDASSEEMRVTVETGIMPQPDAE
jgi:hypothetical protein